MTSLLTAIYMFRLVFLTFHGERAAAGACVTTRHGHGAHGGGHGHDDHGHGGHLHDAPPAMAIPLVVLALGSVLAGYVGVPHALGGEQPDRRLPRVVVPSRPRGAAAGCARRAAARSRTATRRRTAPAAADHAAGGGCARRRDRPS